MTTERISNESQRAFSDNSTVTWQGGWHKGMPHGRGALVFKFGGRHEGEYVDGIQQGLWLESRADGSQSQGSYTDGKKQGQWVEQISDGASNEGTYQAGRQVSGSCESFVRRFGI
jgi:hypothetical protein